MGSGKYQTFYLTEEVYKHTGPDIADLRITDKNGEFVPYYLQYGYKIVFEDTGGGPYRLYYGNPQAAKPHYDLEFYKMHLLKEKQDLSTLGEEQEFSETKTERPAWHFDYLFGLVIILVSLALIVLLVTKLNRNTN